MTTILGMALALALTAQPQPPSVDDLAWMGGRWESAVEGRWTEEIWVPARGGLMLGVNRSGRDGRARAFEFLRIHAGQDGTLVYIAQPGGGTATAFRLVQADGASATFENPDHDFPQRIRYARDGDTMTATISAMDGSNAMSWTFRRMP